jgi:hypothetical protein
MSSPQVKKHSRKNIIQLRSLMEVRIPVSSLEPTIEPKQAKERRKPKKCFVYVTKFSASTKTQNTPQNNSEQKQNYKICIITETAKTQSNPQPPSVQVAHNYKIQARKPLRRLLRITSPFQQILS